MLVLRTYACLHLDDWHLLRRVKHSLYFGNDFDLDLGRWMSRGPRPVHRLLRLPGW